MVRMGENFLEFQRSREVKVSRGERGRGRRDREDRGEGDCRRQRNQVTERRRREGGRSRRQREMKREEKIKVSEWGTGDRPSSSKAVPVSLASLGTARDTETMRTGRRTLKKPFPLH